MKLHNHQIKIERLIAEGKLMLSAGVYHMDVAHDDCCALHEGSVCNCDPDIYMYPEGTEHDRAKRWKVG
jgi:hypothetical protein